MHYINNWITRLTAPLPIGARHLAIDPEAANRLDLSDDYLLTLTDSLDPFVQQVEIVRVSHGLLVERAQEGTAERHWPAQSIIYCSLTAGQMAALQQRAEQLQARIDTLGQRLQDLEEQGGAAPANVLTDPQGRPLSDGQNLLTGALP